MASGGEKVEAVTDFIFLGSKITAGSDSAMKLRHLLLGGKAMINLDGVLKSKDITLPTKVCLVKSYGFSSSHVWMWELDIKKAQHWGIDAFSLWCWRRLLTVSWTARKSTQSILREINSEYSLEGLMLNWSSNTSAAWCEELTHWKRPCCWERLKAGG